MQNTEQTNSERRKVLVVEDDELLRDLLVRKLTSEGFDTESCFDAPCLFDVLEKGKPAIILLDLILPGLDGFGVLERLKADDNLSDVPVLILSNLGQQEDIDRVMALGASGFMVKANFTLGEIVTRIRKVLAEA